MPARHRAMHALRMWATLLWQEYVHESSAAVI